MMAKSKKQIVINEYEREAQGITLLRVEARQIATEISRLLDADAPDAAQAAYARLDAVEKSIAERTASLTHEHDRIATQLRQIRYAREKLEYRQGGKYTKVDNATN